MSTFNFSGLQQKADQALHNADEFVRKWQEFIAAPAGNVNLEYYDRNGNLKTVSFSNRNKLIQDFITNVNSAMNKTFYVDAVNGNDNNDGSSTAPFKTLQKAVNSVSVGGHGKIIFLSDVDITSQIYVGSKHIEIDENTFTLTNNANGLFLLSNSVFKIYNGINNVVDGGLILVKTSSFATVILGDYDPRTRFNLSGTATEIVRAYRTILLGFSSGIDVIDSGTAVKVFNITQNAVNLINEWNNTYSTNATLT